MFNSRKYIVSFILISGLSACTGQSTLMYSPSKNQNWDFELIKSVPAVYPEHLKRNSIEGWVLVGYTIDKRGRVINEHVVDENPKNIFSEYALESVRKSRYKINKNKEKPEIPEIMQRLVRFELEGNMSHSDINCKNTRSTFRDMDCEKIQ